MKQPVLICVLLEIVLCHTLPAQQISNVKIHSINNTIEVIYDLSGPEHLRMDIVVVFTEKSTDAKIVPVTLSGDKLNVKSGRGKKIVWHVLNDRQFIDAEIRASVSAIPVASFKERHRKIPGGPGNAVLSAFLPGLGDVFVNGNEKPKIKPAHIALMFVGCAGMAWYCKNESAKYYSAYQNSFQQYEINSNYEKAVYYDDNSKLMAGIAGAIWVMDVVRVAAKGISNRRAGLNKSSSGNLSFTPGLSKATILYTF